MQSRNQFDDRISNFKNRGALKHDEIRRRREDVTVEIRKQKREESLAKRRNFVPQIDQNASDSDDEIAPTSAISVINFIYIGCLSRAFARNDCRCDVQRH